MARVVSVGKQDFESLRTGCFFYVDKTSFITDWWRSGDDVTLICRPRRFGKTLTLSMVECFFSKSFAGRAQELFGGLDVLEDPSIAALQGTVPVVSLSFAACKRETLELTKASMKRVLREAVDAHGYLHRSESLTPSDRRFLESVSDDMNDDIAADCLRQLCRMLYAHHGTKPVVLLDEYDTPLQEAWLGGWWGGMSSFVRSLFNATFKTNQSLGRALITGITRVASESIFSDMNNPLVVTVTSGKYETAFGFTEAEVAAALDEYGLGSSLADVRSWYDGFTFGEVGGIYNPWSIISYLDERKLAPYWANTSSNALASSLLRGDDSLKVDFESLLAGNTVEKSVEESVDFHALEYDTDAAWALLLASGYLKVERRVSSAAPWVLELALTNHEVAVTFEGIVRSWFGRARRPYNEFCRSLLAGDLEAMNWYLSELAENVMSSFDSGVRPGTGRQPERFWHGLVLGLLVDMRVTHELRSNRESGFGRYDVMLAPRDPAAADSAGDAYVIEFKVADACGDEVSLADALASAHAQIAQRGYDAELLERGVQAQRIRHYGIVFQGKNVLVG